MRRAERTIGWVVAAAVVFGIFVIAIIMLWPSPRSPEPTQGAPLRAVHILGDSFAVSPDFQNAVRVHLPGREITFDAVSGSSLAEQYDRFRQTPDKWQSIVIIMDGGLNEQDQALEPIRQIVALLDTGCGAWAYVEPGRNATHPKGTPEYAEQLAKVRAVEQAYPGHVILSWPAFAAAASTPDDREDVAKGLTPRSLRATGDPIHPAEGGNRVLSQIIAAKVESLDRQPARECTGPSQEQMALAAD